jgi:8-oxo-dGTP diphosphatase
MASTYDPSGFPPFAVTVDLVVLTVRDGALAALLIRRGEEPFAGRLALPGGFVRRAESLDEAATRELGEETGLARLPVHLEQLASYGAVDRDPRMRVVSTAYLALAPDLPTPRAGGDAVAASWIPVAEVLGEQVLGPGGAADACDEDEAGPDRGFGAGADGGADAGVGGGAGTGVVAGLWGAGGSGATPGSKQNPDPDRRLDPNQNLDPDQTPDPAQTPAQTPGSAASSVLSAAHGAGPDSGRVLSSDAASGSGRVSGSGSAPDPGEFLLDPAADGTLAFDHARILADGVERARAKLEYSPLAAAFCPPRFTVGELRRVYEAVWGVSLDPRNFHRKVTGTPGFLVPVGGTTARQGGRPAQLFERGTATLLNPPMLRPA